MGKKLHNARTKLMTITEAQHGYFHLMFGCLAFIVGYLWEPVYFSQHPLQLAALCLLGTFIPDIDHLLYYYGYGRKKDYAIMCRAYLRKRDFKGFFKYVKGNHKQNTGIYSHNFGSVFLAAFFTLYELNKRDNIYMSTFFLAWTFHYVFDILEDFLFFKRPNKNWFFIFNRN
jgi:hypothetical protein